VFLGCLYRSLSLARTPTASNHENPSTPTPDFHK
jgi:hypothetical protein